MTRLFLTGAGAVTHAGLGLDALASAMGGEASFASETPIPDGPAHAVGRIGRLDDPDCASSYKRWGQLDTYSRYGFVAARLAMEDAGIDADTAGRDRIGVMLGTAFGCMEENQRFDRYGVAADGTLKGASPLLFKGTVDNAPAGWIAVAWKLKGPNATYVSGAGSGLEALWGAEGVLRKNRAPALLVGGVERIVDLHLLLREADPARHGATMSEGAGLVLVEREDSLTRRGGRARAELLGVARTRGTYADARAAALTQFGLEPESVSDRFHGLPEGGLKSTLGESHGAWGGIALCAALAYLNHDGSWEGRHHALVHAFGEGDEHFFAALKTVEE
ncbi:MAG: hypothetical protein GY898_21550 [Proteobacteria bacterium]|nr:hypothetical protein [Pseudomonadota bacterium]